MIYYLLLLSEMLRIFVGSDHAGFTLKTAIKEYLQQQGKYQVIDVGT